EARNIPQIEIELELILETGRQSQLDLQGVAVQRQIDERAVRRQAERALERQIDVLHRISRIAFESLQLGGKLVRIIQQIADALVQQWQLVIKQGELLELG